MDDLYNNTLLDPDANADARTIELNNQPSPQQRRITFKAFDSQLHNHVIFNNPHFSKVSLSALEGQNSIEKNFNFKFIDLQVLQIITSNQSGANVYSSKRNNTNQSTMKFNRLILSIFHSN